MNALRVTGSVTLLACTLALPTWSAPAWAQRGLGDDTGAIRQGLDTDRAMLSGRVTEVDIGPCAHTTGRSLSGAHLLVTTESGRTVNLHLGPTAALEALLDTVEPGDTITAEAFRTAAMPANAHVAITVDVNGQQFRLRDDTLQPLWSQSPARNQGHRQGRGMGQGNRLR